MVRLTMDLICRGTSTYTSKKKRDESMQHYLKRLTHLYLEDRCIDEVGEDLSLCRNLMVLYLYDNKLSSMPNLSTNISLTHLYLQNNTIDKIEHLTALSRLSKLYLGGNAITVMEGLEKLSQLQELHMENQKLPPGEKLLFDPRSIQSLSGCLTVLNVTGNNIDCIRDLEPLTGLQQLIASDNQLSDLKDLTQCLMAWRHVSRIDLIGNPFCHKSKYRDRIIIMAPNLEMLDGKEVTATTKEFIQKWQENKDAQKRKQQHSVTHPHNSWSGFVTSEDKNERDLPPVSGYKAPVPAYIMPDIKKRSKNSFALPRKQFQEVLARSTSNPASAGPVNGRPYGDVSPPKLPKIQELHGQLLS